MKKLSYLLMTPLAATLFVGGASGVGGSGCSSSGGSTGTGGSTGSGGSSGVPGDPLVSSATGFVSDPVVTGVIGPWYSYADSIGSGASLASDDSANSDCVKKGGFATSACSVVDSPKGGQPFVPTDMATSKMCTMGTAAKVINGTSGSPDYSDLWGAGIALDFNNPGGDAGAKSDLDLSKFKGVEFDFSGDLIPNNQMRVNFPFTGEHGSDSPYWMGDTNASSPLAVGHMKVNFSDVGGPAYLKNQTPPTTPPPFDKTKVQSIQFQVFTVTSSSTPYSFCVANLTLIPN